MDAVTLKNGQRVYRVKGPDGLWAKKTENIKKIKWVEHEHQATFWRKLHHLKNALTNGVWSDPANLDEIPLGAFWAVEYEVTIERTGRKQRLGELERFHIEENENEQGKV